MEEDSTANNVYQIKPNMKIIVILRNPVDRAYSQYHLNVREKIEKRSFEDTIKENMDILTEELVKKGYNLEETELKEKDWFAVELEYQSRQDRNDKGQLCFEFPIIIRTREDKRLSECEV